MADWKKHVTYSQSYAYGHVFQPEQNPGNPSSWTENGVMDLSNYDSGVTQTYYGASRTVKTDEESPPGSPELYYFMNGQQYYPGSGLVYVADNQTRNLLLDGTYRSEAGGDEGRRSRRDSTTTSDSDAHTSPDSWSSGSSREVSFPQADPSTWAEKNSDDGANGRSPDCSQDVSSSYVVQPPNLNVTENMGDPTPSNVPLPDSKTPSTTAVKSNPQAKARVAFSESQMNALVQRFSVQRYLTPAEMKDLAERTGLTYKQVKTWFQNRRMKLRRHQKDTSWVSERYALNKDSSAHGPAHSSMAPPYLGEGHPRFREHYNQHAMEVAFRSAPQNLAYYFAAVRGASGSSCYPTWSSSPSQSAAHHVPGWSMTPGYSPTSFNSNKFVQNADFESKDREPVSQSNSNTTMLHEVNQ